jgi:hypothetical protein
LYRLLFITIWLTVALFTGRRNRLIPPLQTSYIEVGKPSGIELAMTLANTRKTGVVATPHPDLLVNLFQMGCSEFRLALRITTPKDFVGLNRCPHNGAEVPESLATHEVIHRIHHSGKEVYVRIPNRKIRPRRIIGLAYEKVDALIIEGAEALSAIKLVAEVGA